MYSICLLYTSTVTVKKNDVEVIHCNTSGIFIPKIQIGSFVRENQVLGCIVRPILGAELEEVKSSCDGMIFSLREYPAVCEGDVYKRQAYLQNIFAYQCAIFIIQYTS